MEDYRKPETFSMDWKTLLKLQRRDSLKKVKGRTEEKIAQGQAEKKQNEEIRYK